MKGNVKKVIVFLVQWLIVGGIIVFFIYPRGKSGTVKDLALDKFLNHNNKYSVNLCRKENGNMGSADVIYSYENKDEQANAKKIVDCISGLKVKQKDSVCDGNNNYLITISGEDSSVANITVFDNKNIQVSYEDSVAYYEIEEGGEGLKDIETLLDKPAK